MAAQSDLAYGYLAMPPLQYSPAPMQQPQTLTPSGIDNEQSGTRPGLQNEDKQMEGSPTNQELSSSSTKRALPDQPEPLHMGFKKARLLQTPVNKTELAVELDMPSQNSHPATPPRQSTAEKESTQLPLLTSPTEPSISSQIQPDSSHSSLQNELHMSDSQMAQAEASPMIEINSAEGAEHGPQEHRTEADTSDPAATSDGEATLVGSVDPYEKSAVLDEIIVHGPAATASPKAREGVLTDGSTEVVDLTANEERPAGGEALPGHVEDSLMLAAFEIILGDHLPAMVQELSAPTEDESLDWLDWVHWNQCAPSVTPPHDDERPGASGNSSPSASDSGPFPTKESMWAAAHNEEDRRVDQSAKVNHDVSTVREWWRKIDDPTSSAFPPYAPGDTMLAAMPPSPQSLVGEHGARR